MKLTIATSQFPVSSDIHRNYRYIAKQAYQARSQGALVLHLPEGSLSGYAGPDFSSFKNFDWDLLKSKTEEVVVLAKALKIWIILGSVVLPSVFHYIVNSIRDSACIFDPLCLEMGSAISVCNIRDT